MAVMLHGLSRKQRRGDICWWRTGSSMRAGRPTCALAYETAIGVTKYLTRQPQITFVFGGEADADFRLLQFLNQITATGMIGGPWTKNVLKH
jgi:hypothetical protein